MQISASISTLSISEREAVETMLVHLSSSQKQQLKFELNNLLHNQDSLGRMSADQLGQWFMASLIAISMKS